MKIPTRNGPVHIDGTQGTQPGTGNTDVSQRGLPTSRPRSEGALAPISSGGAEQASRADSSTRARTFRYGTAADASGVASDATSLLQAASAVRNMDGLQDLIAKLLASAKASAASKSGVSLEPHYEALEKAAARVSKWSPLDAQVEGLRELKLAYVEMPHAEQTSLGAAIDTAYEKAFSSRGTQLANQVNSAQSFVDKLGQLMNEARAWPGLARAVAVGAFLEEAADRLTAFPANEIAEGHQLLSDTIMSSPPWVADGADEKLCKLEANELLPPPVKTAYEEGERLAKTAESVHDLAGVDVLLSKPGIVGPNVPDDLLGLARLNQYDGNLHVLARLRPEPLAVLATRVGSFEPTEASQAFSAIFDKVDEVQPACRRVASLMALATAASQLADPAREQAYGRVLNTARTLRQQQQINSEQQALVLKALRRAIAQRAEGDAGPAEQAALHALRGELRSGYELAA